MKTFKMKTIQDYNWYDTIFSLLFDPRRFVHSLFFWHSIGDCAANYLWSMILEWIIILISWNALNIERLKEKHSGLIHKPQIANKMKMIENCWFWYIQTNWILQNKLNTAEDLQLAALKRLLNTERWILSSINKQQMICNHEQRTILQNLNWI